MKENYKLISRVMGPAGTNVYIFYNTQYKGADGKMHCVVIDPADRGDMIAKMADENKLAVDAMLLTHAHFDHIGGVKTLKEKTGAKLYCGEDEKSICENPELNLSVDFGTSFSVSPDVCFKDGEEAEFAGMKFKVIFTPGHTSGGVCYYCEDAGVLFSGDTLFAQSVGRTDFPTGSMSTLVRSIKEKLFVLPDDTEVFPGHMGATTIATEKRYNPFL